MLQGRGIGLEVRMTYRRSVVARAVWVAAAIAVGLSGCAKKEPVSADARTLSEKLNPFVYYEIGSVMFLAVDTRAASYVDDATMFPLGLGISNLSQGSLTFKREQIIVEDSAGRRYPVVSYDEYRRDYKRSRSDAELGQEFAGIMETRYGNFRSTPWALFPAGGSTAPVVNQVEVGRNEYVIGYLYFPMPEGGIDKKKFKLLVRADEYPEPFLIGFAID